MKNGMLNQSIGRHHPGVAAIFVFVFFLSAFVISPASGQILSAKRGFGDTGGSYSYLQATNAGWYHTWGPGVGGGGGFDALHIPMFRWWNDTQGTIDSIKNRSEPTVWVMGFNEPEREDQDNMSVSEAIQRWTLISNGFAGTGIKLVSPAVSDNSTGRAWMTDFRNQVYSNGLTVDAVAFHWYGWSTPDNPSQAATNFINSVNWYHNLWNKPVFISEFAIHDWGGNYSDEAVREANRQFLSIVIPQLESMSYVEGYAWYHWFGDAKLVEGSPLEPTNVGLEYVGVLENGSVFDFSGTDLGAHVAYLAGAELSHNSGGGNLNHITALSGYNTLSGSVDWILDGYNWVRIKPGATLSKTGPNQVTWDDAPVTNEGTIEVLDGHLQFDFCEFSGSGNMRIESGASVGYQASRRVTIEHDVELDGGTIGTNLAGGFILASGFTLEGEGEIHGAIQIRDGAFVQVGAPGLPSWASQAVIDDFESYTTGLLRDVANPPWTAHGSGSGTMFASIEDDGSGSNQVLTYGWADNHRGASRPLPEGGKINDGDVATFFFRFNSKTDDPDHNFGLSDQVNTDALFDYSDYEVQMRFYSDSNSTSGTFGLDARSEGSFVDLVDSLTTNTWYNLWLVVDQSSDTFDAYLNTGVADATAGDKLNAAPLSFRYGTSGALDTILAMAGPAPIDLGLRIDDLTFLTGEDLTNPLGGLNADPIYLAETLMCDNNFTMNPGATLELGIHNPAAVDRLDVGGTFTAAGTLDASLAEVAPFPAAGDVFDVIDAVSITGSFEQVILTELDTGMVWDMRNLYTTGEISVQDGQILLLDCITCMSGPGAGILSGCEDWDLDSDNDVDLTDYAEASVCVMNESGRLAPGCLGE